MADAELTGRLIDEVTGPSRKMLSSLKRLESGMTGLARRGSVLGGALTEVAIGGLRRFGELAVSAAGSALELGKGLAAGVGGAVAFQESMQFSLERFLGDSGKANAALDRLLEQSNTLGIDFQSATGQFKEFVSAGFDIEKSFDLVSFKADLLAVSGGTEFAKQEIDQSFLAIGKAIATGRFEADEFIRVFKAMPVDKLAIMEKLAPKVGKTVEDLMKTEITQLPVTELIEAMQEASLEGLKASKVGETAMAAQTKTVFGAVAAIKARFKNLFDVLASRVGPKALEQIAGATRSILDALDSPAAMAAIDGIGNAILRIIPFALRAGAAMLRFGAGILNGLTQVMPVINQATAAFKFLAGGTQGAEASGRLLGQVLGLIAGATIVSLGVVLALANAIVFLASQFSDAGSVLQSFFVTLKADISAAVGEVGAAAAEIGTAIIDGIVSAVSSGAGKVAKAVALVSGGAVGAAVAVIQPGSPSRVFERLFATVPQGMVAGMMGGGPGVSTAAAGLSGASIAGALSGMGGSTFNTPVTARFQINAADDPAATAAAVRDVLVTELGDALENVAIQIGVAPA